MRGGLTLWIANNLTNDTLYLKMYVGDCRKILTSINEQFQLVVTSPPYWNARNYECSSEIGFNQTMNEYLEELMKVWKEIVRLLLPDGKIAVNIGNIYYSNFDEKRKTTANLILLLWNQLNTFDELRFMGTIYWQKTTLRNGRVLWGSYPYPSNFLISTAVEAIHVFRKRGERKVSKEIKEASKITKEEFQQYQNNIWQINGRQSKNHPAVFPSELPKRLIKMYSFVEDVVLDPFCGLGTTNLEAIKLNRNSVGIDINPRYIQEALLSAEKINTQHKVILIQ